MRRLGRYRKFFFVYIDIYIYIYICLFIPKFLECDLGLEILRNSFVLPGNNGRQEIETSTIVFAFVGLKEGKSDDEDDDFDSLVHKAQSNRCLVCLFLIFYYFFFGKKTFDFDKYKEIFPLHQIFNNNNNSTTIFNQPLRPCQANTNVRSRLKISNENPTTHPFDATKRTKWTLYRHQTSKKV